MDDVSRKVDLPEFLSFTMAVAWILKRNAGSVEYFRGEPLGPLLPEEDGFGAGMAELRAILLAGEIDCDAIVRDRNGYGGRRDKVPVEELSQEGEQYDASFDIVYVSSRTGNKYSDLRVPSHQVLRIWPGRVSITEQEPIHESFDGTYSLFDAVVFLARHDPKGRPEAESFGDALERLRRLLVTGTIVASGTALDGMPGPIPPACWHRARWGVPHTHSRFHSIGFIETDDGVDGPRYGGSLTLHSRFKEKEPDWIDIRVPAEAIRAQVAKTLSKLSAATEAKGESDGGEIAVDYDKTRGAPTIVSSAHQEEQGVLTFETIRARVAEDGGIAQLTPSWDATYRAIQSLWPRGEIVRKRKKRNDDIWGVTGKKDGPSDSTLDAFFRRYLPEIVRKQS